MNAKRSSRDNNSSDDDFQDVQIFREPKKIRNSRNCNLNNKNSLDVSPRKTRSKSSQPKVYQSSSETSSRSSNLVNSRSKPRCTNSSYSKITKQKNSFGGAVAYSNVRSSSSSSNSTNNVSSPKKTVTRRELSTSPENQRSKLANGFSPESTKNSDKYSPEIVCIESSFNRKENKIINANKSIVGRDFTKIDGDLSRIANRDRFNNDNEDECDNLEIKALDLSNTQFETCLENNVRKFTERTACNKLENKSQIKQSTEILSCSTTRADVSQLNRKEDTLKNPDLRYKNVDSMIKTTDHNSKVSYRTADIPHISNFQNTANSISEEGNDNSTLGVHFDANFGNVDRNKSPDLEILEKSVCNSDEKICPSCKHIVSLNVFSNHVSNCLQKFSYENSKILTRKNARKKAKVKVDKDMEVGVALSYSLDDLERANRIKKENKLVDLGLYDLLQEERRIKPLPVTSEASNWFDKLKATKKPRPKRGLKSKVLCTRSNEDREKIITDKVNALMKETRDSFDPFSPNKKKAHMWALSSEKSSDVNALCVGNLGRWIVPTQHSIGNLLKQYTDIPGRLDFTAVSQDSDCEENYELDSLEKTLVDQYCTQLALAGMIGSQEAHDLTGFETSYSISSGKTHDLGEFKTINLNDSQKIHDLTEYKANNLIDSDKIDDFTKLQTINIIGSDKTDHDLAEFETNNLIASGKTRDLVQFEASNLTVSDRTADFIQLQTTNLIGSQNTHNFAENGENGVNLSENEVTMTENDDKEINIHENELKISENEIILAANVNVIGRKINKVENEINIMEIKAKINENDVNITQNDVNLTENDMHITENDVNITKNDVNVTENHMHITENDLNITQHDVNLIENDMHITKNDMYITENDMNITENDMNITENDVNITEEEAKISENDVNITENDVNLSENIVNISENEEIFSENEECKTVQENITDNEENKLSNYYQETLKNEKLFTEISKGENSKKLSKDILAEQNFKLKLINDWRSILNSGLNSDIVLMTSKGHLNLHSLVLGVRCPIILIEVRGSEFSNIGRQKFDALSENQVKLSNFSDTKNKKMSQKIASKAELPIKRNKLLEIKNVKSDKFIDWSNINHDVAYTFCEYLYCGNLDVKVESETWFGVFDLALKYEIKELVKYFENSYHDSNESSNDLKIKKVEKCSEDSAFYLKTPDKNDNNSNLDFKFTANVTPFRPEASITPKRRIKTPLQIRTISFNKSPKNTKGLLEEDVSGYVIESSQEKFKLGLPEIVEVQKEKAKKISLEKKCYRISSPDVNKFRKSPEISILDERKFFTPNKPFKNSKAVQNYSQNSKSPDLFEDVDFDTKNYDCHEITQQEIKSWVETSPSSVSSRRYQRQASQSASGFEPCEVSPKSISSGKTQVKASPKYLSPIRTWCEASPVSVSSAKRAYETTPRKMEASKIWRHFSPEIVGTDFDNILTPNSSPIPTEPIISKNGNSEKTNLISSKNTSASVYLRTSSNSPTISRFNQSLENLVDSPIYLNGSPTINNSLKSSNSPSRRNLSIDFLSNENLEQKKQKPAKNLEFSCSKAFVENTSSPLSLSERVRLRLDKINSKSKLCVSPAKNSVFNKASKESEDIFKNDNSLFFSQPCLNNSKNRIESKYSNNSIKTGIYLSKISETNSSVNLKQSHSDDRTKQSHDDERTPVQKKISKCVSVTPLPDYNSMLTPELRRELDKYGIRKLSRKKAVTLLLHIYEQTHPTFTPTHVTDSSTKNVSKPVRSKSKKSNISEPKSLGLKKSIVKKSKKISSKAVRLSKENYESSASQTISPKSSKKPTFLIPESPKKKKNSEDLNSSLSSINSIDSDVECLEETILPISSKYSDTDTDNGISTDIYIDENDIITPSQQVNMNDRLLSFIRSDSALYQKILEFEPIWVTELHEKLKENGIKCGLARLIQFLDEKCVTFRMPHNERKKRKRKSPTKKKGRRKVQE